MLARFSSRTPLAAPSRLRPLLGAGLLATSGAALAACTGLGAPATTETKCLTAVQIRASAPVVDITGSPASRGRS